MNNFKLSIQNVTLFLLLIVSCDESLPGDPSAIVTGLWSGEHIRLEATIDSITIIYDCAVGKIYEPIIPEGEDEFTLLGTHTFETGGPVIEGARPDIHPAKFEGNVASDVMTLTVSLTDTTFVIGTFTLQYNNEGNVYRCY
ncbi:hypothetical protein ACFLR4_04115 [Bacteroidota bacterium]